MATFQKRPVPVEIRRAEGVEEIETREGTVYANEADGDLVAEGVEGEVYPIGARILAKTYAPDADDEEAREIYRECLPTGVRVEFEDVGAAAVAHAVYVVEDEISNDEERREAEAFVREFIASSPHLHGSGAEVPYA